MNKLDRFSWSCHILCAISLILGFTLIGKWQVNFAVVLLMVLFCIGWILKWKWMPEFILTLQCLLAMVGCLFGASFFWMMLATSAGLAAWDLQGYQIKLSQGMQISKGWSIEDTHLIYLGIILGLGVLLSTVTMFIHFRISFWSAIILSLLVIIGLSQTIRHLRKL